MNPKIWPQTVTCSVWWDYGCMQSRIVLWGRLCVKEDLRSWVWTCLPSCGLVCQVDIKRQHLCPNTAASHQATYSHRWVDVFSFCVYRLSVCLRYITNTFFIYWAKRYKKCNIALGIGQNFKWYWGFLFERADQGSRVWQATRVHFYSIKNMKVWLVRVRNWP